MKISFTPTIAAAFLPSVPGLSPSHPFRPRDLSGLAGVVLNGLAYLSDMSGVSTLKGTITADGTISAVLNPISGNGPAGSVTGQRIATSTYIQMNGVGCSKANFDLLRLTGSR